MLARCLQKQTNKHKDNPNKTKQQQHNNKATYKHKATTKTIYKTFR